MSRILTALLGLGLAFATPAASGDDPVVVELFTSQGCSSCPPADAIMRELAQREDVIGLALHVDYWDYIGWKDQFALPSHKVRQQAYARVAGRSMIYTPQMIVGGQSDIRGADQPALERAIERHGATAPLAELHIETAEGRVTVTATGAGQAVQPPADVVLVRYQPLRHSEIKRGENAGRNLDYANVVTSWERLGEWDGQGEAQFSSDWTGDLPAVVLLQRRGPGAIIAAKRVE
ncbi:DUF1223 domain-containing protein [Lutimaribacter marinistellae]|uniref:DUF1223 domain-containing protein n=1 Tax=Lutimaribacter marinistellae TaxID=1820329 RepID=A0ABV7TK56_9RHOB